MQLTEKEQKVIDWLNEKTHEGVISQAAWVQIFELASLYGQIYTRSMAGRVLGKSYNGVKHRVKPVNFPQAKLVTILKP